jgi:hypothetical protein
MTGISVKRVKWRRGTHKSSENDPWNQGNDRKCCRNCFGGLSWFCVEFVGDEWLGRVMLLERMRGHYRNY